MLNFKKSIFFIFFFAYLPVAPILTKFLPLSLTGSSFWDTEFPFLALLIYIFTNRSIKKKSDFFLAYLFFVSVIFICLIRSLIFHEDIINTLFSSWFIFFPLLVILVLRDIDLQKNIKAVNIILFLQIGFHGILGWLYILGLPTIEFEGISKVIDGRFEGIYGASNVYSNYLISFFLLFILLNQEKIILIILSSVLVIGGVISSGSRGPLILFFLVLTFFIFKSLQFKKLKTLFLIIILGLITRLTFNNAPVEISSIRIFEIGISDEGRFAKNSLAIDGLGSSIQSLLLGLHGSQFTRNGIEISDNSFTLIPISYGVIVFGFWSLLIILFSQFKLVYFRNFNIVFYLICMGFIFSANNAILWLPWVYFSIFGYYVLSNSSSKTSLPNRKNGR